MTDLTNLLKLTKENGYQKAVDEMLQALPYDGTPERMKLRTKLWDMAFTLKDLTEDQKQQLIQTNERSNTEARG